MAWSEKSSACIIHLILMLSVIFCVASTALKKEIELLLSEPNREEKLAKFPITTDLRRQSGNIAKAHDILRKTLQEFLDFAEADLEIYLNEMIERVEPYIDEYGQEITLYKKVFSFILQQRHEVMVQNYAVSYFDKDKLDMCSVARYLSHQSSLKERRTLMKRMGDALGYRCHPCTPYKRRQYGETKVPDTENISPDGVSPEESLIMCNSSKPSPPTASVRTGIEPPNTTQESSVPSTETNATTDDQQINDPRLNYGLCKYSVSKQCKTINDCRWSQRGDVICENAALAHIKKIFLLTSRTTFDTIKLDILPSDRVIPEDILANKRAINLNIGSQTTVQTELVIVDPNAFRSTKNFTKTIIVHGFDCTHLDLAFLSGFDQLINFTLAYSSDIEYSLPTLPPLPSLSILDITFALGLEEMQTFPNLVNGLKYATFVSREDAVWSHSKISNVLDWILLSSADSLEYLTFESNYQLTQIPKQIVYFKALSSLNLRDCNIKSISPGALSFSVPVKTLNLLNNEIAYISPGAFRGDFKDAEINMRENSMTRFDESIFRPLLKQMDFGTGYIDATKNEMDCDDICPLSWLYRDDIRHLLMDKVFVGPCPNNTQFYHKQLTDFSHCPGWETDSTLP